MLLTLEKYFVLESNIKANSEFVSDSNKKVDLEVEAAGDLYENNEDGNKFRIVISITFDRKKGSRKNSVPYGGSVKMDGFFSLDGNVPNKKRESLLMVNGLSVLYSAAREHIASVTGRGPWEALYLPIISFRQDETKIDGEITGVNGD